MDSLEELRMAVRVASATESIPEIAVRAGLSAETVYSLMRGVAIGKSSQRALAEAVRAPGAQPAAAESGVHPAVIEARKNPMFVQASAELVLGLIEQAGVRLRALVESGVLLNAERPADSSESGGASIPVLQGYVRKEGATRAAKRGPGRSA